MNENLFNYYKIIFLNSTTQYTIRPRLCTSKYPVLAKNDILGFTAYCVLLTRSNFSRTNVTS